jgi:hypothetical protein
MHLKGIEMCCVLSEMLRVVENEMRNCGVHIVYCNSFKGGDEIV